MAIIAMRAIARMSSMVGMVTINLAPKVGRGPSSIAGKAGTTTPLTRTTMWTAVARRRWDSEEGCDSLGHRWIAHSPAPKRLGGTIILPAGIIGVLCKDRASKPYPYIRSPAE